MNKPSGNILVNKFLSAAVRHQERPALDVRGQTMTYKVLVNRSLAIAVKVIEAASDQSPVAVMASRNEVAYLGILGSLMASRPYMPLNPRFPILRNLQMIKKAKCTTVIVSRDNKEAIEVIKNESGLDLHIIEPEDDYDLKDEKTFPPELPEITTKENDIAYLLFTSGTTGEPKGVPVSNKNVVSYLDHILNKFDFKSTDRFSQTFDLTFDLSVHDLFVCWLSGACLCIPEQEAAFAFPKYINEKKISIWFSVPSLAVMMDKMRVLRPGYFNQLRYSMFCGEPLLVDTASAWQTAAPGSRVINLYGPTEATIAISSYEWNLEAEKNKSRNGIVSIGKIFETQHYRIFDELKGVTATGEPGLLLLAGDQVINGYLDSIDKDANSFTRIVGQGEKHWYNTGDLVSEDHDRDLFFLGRRDNEVKISGYRVNLLEVDNTLRKYPGTGSVATIAVDDENNNVLSLVSFIERSHEALREVDVLDVCRRDLPWYMIPARIVFVEAIPLNENGKTDRNKLLEML